jgi:ribosomal protein S16
LYSRSCDKHGKKKRNVYRILVDKENLKDNNTQELKEIGWEATKWNYLAQDTDK